MMGSDGRKTIHPSTTVSDSNSNNINISIHNDNDNDDDNDNDNDDGRSGANGYTNVGLCLHFHRSEQ